MDCVIRELCNKGKFLTKELYRKMTILWSFSYNSCVKINDKNCWKPPNSVFSKSVL